MGNSSRFCARYLSSSVSLPCFIVLCNPPHLPPSTIFISANVSRSLMEVHLRKTKDSNFLDAWRNNKEPSESVRRYALSVSSPRNYSSQSSRTIHYRSIKSPTITTPLRLLISLHTGVMVVAGITHRWN